MKLIHACVLVLMLCVCGCGEQEDGPQADGDGPGTTIEVRHKGMVYLVWTHDGTYSESAVLLDKWPEGAAE